VKSEHSAGGLVLHLRDDVQQLAVVRPRADRLALPKGHPEPGETLEQAALREVREETGLTAELVEGLGEVQYWYRFAGERVRKTVTFFLCRYQHGSLADHDDEVIEALWIPLAEAPKRLSYRGEREMASKALARGQTGSDGRPDGGPDSQK